MDLVLSAVADPVRREILLLLAAGPQPAGAIADRFPISRPAVSRHLRVLRQSGLVRDEVTGRQRLYRLDPRPLEELVGWLARLTVPELPVWQQRLDALGTEVHRTRRDARRAGDRRPAAHRPVTEPRGTDQEESA